MCGWTDSEKVEELGGHHVGGELLREHSSLTRKEVKYDIQSGLITRPEGSALSGQHPQEELTGKRLPLKIVRTSFRFHLSTRVEATDDWRRCMDYHTPDKRHCVVGDERQKASMWEEEVNMRGDGE